MVCYFASKVLEVRGDKVLADEATRDLWLRVERDRYFTPARPLSVYAAEARAAES